jgi:hypothetical protein
MVEVGGKLVEQFAANLAQLIAGDSPAGSAADGDPATPAGTVSEAAGSVDGLGAPAATTDASGGNGASSGAAGPADGTAAGTAAGPAAGTAAGPMASTVTAPLADAGAPAQDDSLNLLAIAGPVLLKRLVPVVIGAAGLVLLSRLFWRRRRGPRQAEEA